MLNKSGIIRKALLKVGEVGSYNDNKSDVYKIADVLLSGILDDLGAREDFLFNSRTSILDLNSQTTNEFGEFRYNIPSDFLNKIRFIEGDARIENEFIYSFDDRVVLRYCFKAYYSDYPDYLYKYLVYALAVELSESFNQYRENLKIMNVRLQEETIKIYNLQFVPVSKVI